MICSAGNLATCAVTVLDHYTRHHSTGRRAPLSSHFGFARCGTWSTTAFFMCKNAALTFVTVVALYQLFNHPRLLDAGAKFDFQSAIPRSKNSRSPYGCRFRSFQQPLRAEMRRPGRQGGNQTYCLSTPEGAEPAGSGFFSNQTMFNIYEARLPSTNAYPDITETDCRTGYNGGCIYGSGNAMASPNRQTKISPAASICRTRRLPGSSQWLLLPAGFPLRQFVF